MVMTVAEYENDEEGELSHLANGSATAARLSEASVDVRGTKRILYGFYQQ